MSAPSPAIANVSRRNDARPATPTAPMSLELHGDGNRSPNSYSTRVIRQRAGNAAIQLSETVVTPLPRRVSSRPSCTKEPANTNGVTTVAEPLSGGRRNDPENRTWSDADPGSKEPILV